MFNRHFQIKVVKDQKERNETAPVDTANSSEAIAIEVVQQTTACVVACYALCRSVNFIFGMAEHVIATKL